MSSKLLDPGGTLIKKVTGSDIGLDVADPAKLFSRPQPSVQDEINRIQSTKRAKNTGLIKPGSLTR